MNFQDIKCRLSFHRWIYSKRLTLYDIFPSPFDSKYETPVRVCENCKEQQKWLPGYGGSEIGFGYNRRIKYDKCFVNKKQKGVKRL